MTNPTFEGKFETLILKDDAWSHIDLTPESRGVFVEYCKMGFFSSFRNMHALYALLAGSADGEEALTQGGGGGGAE